MSFVIIHPEFGIYLGSCFGLGFWSKVDPAGQNFAVAFSSVDEAKEFILTWEQHPPVEDFSFVPVQADTDGYVSQEACVEAGLDWWGPSASCTVN